ncbi:hypothetical protein GE09DRAFT_699042 [Coniochaeta sp. 2T2.1]|nr:hypothetical protein GE09DRAFT_699042 [Coniochaeta sp. 2T2.1]
MSPSLQPSATAGESLTMNPEADTFNPKSGPVPGPEPGSEPGREAGPGPGSEPGSESEPESGSELKSEQPPSQPRRKRKRPNRDRDRRRNRKSWAQQRAPPHGFGAQQSRPVGQFFHAPPNGFYIPPPGVGNHAPPVKEPFYLQPNALGAQQPPPVGQVTYPQPNWAQIPHPGFALPLNQALDVQPGTYAHRIQWPVSAPPLTQAYGSRPYTLQIPPPGHGSPAPGVVVQAYHAPPYGPHPSHHGFDPQALTSAHGSLQQQQQQIHQAHTPRFNNIGIAAQQAPPPRGPGHPDSYDTPGSHQRQPHSNVPVLTAAECKAFWLQEEEDLCLEVNNVRLVLNVETRDTQDIQHGLKWLADLLVQLADTAEAHTPTPRPFSGISHAPPPPGPRPPYSYDAPGSHQRQPHYTDSGLTAAELQKREAIRLRPNLPIRQALQLANNPRPQASPGVSHAPPPPDPGHPMSHGTPDDLRPLLQDTRLQQQGPSNHSIPPPPGLYQAPSPRHPISHGISGTRQQPPQVSFGNDPNVQDRRIEQQPQANHHRVPPPSGTYQTPLPSTAPQSIPYGAPATQQQPPSSNLTASRPPAVPPASLEYSLHNDIIRHQTQANNSSPPPSSGVNQTPPRGATAHPMPHGASRTFGSSAEESESWSRSTFGGLSDEAGDSTSEGLLSKGRREAEPARDFVEQKQTEKAVSPGTANQALRASDGQQQPGRPSFPSSFREWVSSKKAEWLHTKRSQTQQQLLAQSSGGPVAQHVWATHRPDCRTYPNESGAWEWRV